MPSIGFQQVCRVMVVGVALGLQAMAATAQDRGGIGGPAEIPPASYEDQTYVDSQGCVFLRAGYGGAVNWVPRVSAERKALCGYPPTFADGPAPVGTEAAPPPPPVAAAPAPTMASPAPKAPVVAAVRDVPARRKPQRNTRKAARVAAPPPTVQVRCDAAAPTPWQFRTTDGRSVILCTRGDGTMEGLRAPVGSGLRFAVAPAAPKARPAPSGYKPAWKDGRLNPLRGRGTAAGQASQDTVWTREIPATLIYPSGRTATRVVIQRVISAPSTGARTVVVETKRDGTAWHRTFVQVGTFGNPTNAEATRARLRATGLPVGTARDGARQVILAGPFATRDAARSALVLLRQSGFSDAFLR